MATTATVSAIRALAKAPPGNDLKARKEIYEAARELMYAVEPPAETDSRIFFAVSHFHQRLQQTTRLDLINEWIQAGELSFTEIACDLHLFETLVEDTSKAWSVQELAEKAGADPILLRT